MKIKNKYTGEILVTINGDALQGADLRLADLQGANLQGAVGDGTIVRSAQFERYHIVSCDDWLQIGCKGHRVHEWRSFSDETIAKMDDDALEWWNKYKYAVLSFADCP